MSYNPSKIGNKIRTERENLGLSQEKLLFILEEKGYSMSRKTLSNIENGNFTKENMNILLLNNLSEIFDADIEHLLCNQKCRHHEEQTIHEVLNISKKSAEELKKMDAESIFVLDKLISHPYFISFIKKIRNYLHSANIGIVIPDTLNNSEDDDSGNLLLDNALQPDNPGAVHKFIINDTLNKMLEDIFIPFEQKGKRLFVEYCARQVFESIFYSILYENDDFLIEAQQMYRLIVLEKINHPILNYTLDEIIKKPKEIWKKIYNYDLPEDIETFDFNLEYVNYNLID